MKIESIPPIDSTKFPSKTQVSFPSEIFNQKVSLAFQKLSIFTPLSITISFTKILLNIHPFHLLSIMAHSAITKSFASLARTRSTM